MPFDGILTNRLIKELKSELIGGIVRKVYQPETDEIRLSINKDKQNLTLLISANNNNARIHLTETKKSNPIEPPTFCMSLRKYLIGSILTDITQLESDRVLVLSFKHQNELFETQTIKLICEITGKNANIILVLQKENELKILDALKHIGNLKSTYRQILPGKEYLAPPSENKTSLYNENFNSLKEKLLNSNLSLEKFFKTNYLGLSPSFLRELAYQSNLEVETELKKLSEKEIDTLANTFFFLLNLKDKPCLFKSNDKILDFYPFKLTHLGATTLTYSSLSKLLEDFYSLRDKDNHFRAKSANLKHQLSSLKKKYARKIQNLNKDLNKAKKAHEYKKKADVITANIWQLKPGISSAELMDYSLDPPNLIEVNLNPQLSPSENAQKLYTKYNKAKRAQVELKKQLEKTEEDLNYIDSLLTALNISTEINELDEIKDEFNQSSLINQKKGKKKISQPSKPMHFISSEGFNIFVGKNNYQNDYLVTKVGQAEDCWLHVKDAPGSHVLIKADNRFITEQTVLEGGELAAYYSSQSNSENIPVNYTEFKYVKKPKGVKPGMVTFTNNNTMFVTPNLNRLKELKRIN